MTARRRDGSSSRSSKWAMTTEGIGEATAAAARWVSTVTSVTPMAPSPVTAPRAVAPKLMTTARRRLP